MSLLLMVGTRRTNGVRPCSMAAIHPSTWSTVRTCSAGPAFSQSGPAVAVQPGGDGIVVRGSDGEVAGDQGSVCAVVAGNLGDGAGGGAVSAEPGGDDAGVGVDEPGDVEFGGEHG